MTAIIVTGNQKEIADLVLAVQGRQTSVEDTAKDVVEAINNLTRRAKNPVLLL